MQNKKIQLSIIIVNYKANEELFDCIFSIVSSRSKIEYEIIVVDNDIESTIEKKLINKFSKVKYIKSKSNLGYGGGNNLGVSHAKGAYLFFLNPDTKVMHAALDNLYSFLNKTTNTGIASPLFLKNNLEPFNSQGSGELTPNIILLSQSFLRKIFKHKNIYNRNALKDWNMDSPRSVEAVPGAAMMIKADFFKKIKGFDESFFLYFEENDISKRVRDLGYKLFIVPSSKIIHLVGKSTKNLKKAENIYAKSRFKYLRKHYGLLRALFTQLILFVNGTSISLLFILILALFLRFYNIANNMPFIGDQGWFYLSARDALVKGQIPLVGIASSHPWLHQGPLWTYMLVGVFWLFGFNPLNGVYLTIILGLVSVFLMYVVGSEMFSKRIGLISALLCATSPLVIIHSRTPYHTSPIPLITVLYIFSLYKFVKGNKIFFPLSILFLSVLYNLELATVILWFILFVILIYGMWRKTEWIKKIFNKKILTYSILSFLIPMTPILIYDFNHGFPQTFKFIIWMGYGILKFFGFPNIHGQEQSVGWNSMVSFSFYFYQKLIYAANNIIAFIILTLGFGALMVNAYKSFKNKTYDLGIVLLTLWILVSIVGFFVNKTASEAYLPIFFPALIYLTAFSFDKIMKIKILFIPTILLIAFITFANSYYVISSEYTSNKLDLSKRVSIVKQIIKEADGRDYNIVGAGEGNEFESFTMNYEYLAWWMGHPPAKYSQKLNFIIREDGKRIVFVKEQ